MPERLRFVLEKRKGEFLLDLFLTILQPYFYGDAHELVVIASMTAPDPLEVELGMRERAQGGVGGWLEEEEEGWRDEVGESYYLDMLRDDARNKAYRDALERAVAGANASRGSASVLDIGTGSGLLAMMAKRAGAPDLGAACCARAVHALARTVHRQGACARHAPGTAATSSRAATHRQEQRT